MVRHVMQIKSNDVGKTQCISLVVDYKKWTETYYIFLWDQTYVSFQILCEN